jgi:adenylosuccinate lyase
MVEVEYFMELCGVLPQLSHFPTDQFDKLRDIYLEFSLADAKRVKEIEKVTNHDVKAVEYFLKDRFSLMGLERFGEFIHFGLTSQDINNTAFPMALRDAFREVVEPMIENVIGDLLIKSQTWKNIPMLAHTHGQPASPTTVGKEIYVFVERLGVQHTLLSTIPFSAKFGGATGNFNAHAVAYPEIDWIAFANRFVNETLQLERCQTTTQIEHYDNLAAFFDNLSRINTILIDFARDTWTYISMDYFTQKVKSTETGSSAMPHKVNPIDFENAEGNLGIANALFAHFSSKLPVSRLQRDLTDSTVIRNIGIPLAHSLIAYHSLVRGLGKIILNEKKLEKDLNANWAVISEAIQTILRREGYPNPYEVLKELTRGNKRVTREILHQFIDQLDIDVLVRDELKQISPGNYTGIIRFLE